MEKILLVEDLLKHFRGNFDVCYTSANSSASENSGVLYTIEFTDSSGSMICFKKRPNQNYLLSYHVDNQLRFDSSISLELVEECTIRVSGQLDKKDVKPRRIPQVSPSVWKDILAFVPEKSIKRGKIDVNKDVIVGKLKAEWNNKTRKSDSLLIDKYKISNNINMIDLVFDVSGQHFLKYIMSDNFEKNLLEKGLPSKAKIEKVVDFFDDRLFDELNDCVSYTIYPYMWITGNSVESDGGREKREAKKILDKFKIEI